MDKLANMEAFAVVAETGSFAETARRLNLANSVVSKRIRDLEDFLGTQLFNRTTRRVTLTETGYGYLEYVRRLLDDLNEIESRIRHDMDEPTGTIRLAAPLSYGQKYLSRAIASYLEKYPRVSIRLYLSDRRVNLVEEGYDLAIRSGPLEDSNLVARRLQRCRRVVCATPEYFRQHGKPTSPEELRDHNCMSYLNVADGKSWPFRVGGKKIWQSISGSFSADNGGLLREMALAHKGIVLLPTFIVGESLSNGSLEVVLADFEEDDFSMYAVYQHTHHLSIKVRTLIDHLAEYFSTDGAMPA